MWSIKNLNLLLLCSFGAWLVACSEDSLGDALIEKEPDEEVPVSPDNFYFGADLSYVNQLLDFGGTFSKDGVEKDPYQIFQEFETDMVRLRIWHNPTWTKEVYGEDGKQLYNDLYDVERAIRASKEQGMTVLLDFHYSDEWADPGKQFIPEAWREIVDIDVLADSVYNYTFKTLTYLNEKGLMPEFVQIGNETNCGMMYSEASVDFPPCNVCEDGWSNMARVLNEGIAAVRAVSSDTETQVILHVADPKNISWWFEAAIKNQVTDFDIIGFSYYPIWHTDVPVNGLSNKIAEIKLAFNKEVMIVETAYPWTSDGNDSYNNIFGGTAAAGYPISPSGQLAILKDITQAVIDGGGIGVIYWEPAWISSDMKDLWGTGSAWENNAFFDFDGNANQAFDYQLHSYTIPD